jgi:2',3'-cyclic-nucleotide 2'-phosphodiesterase (5'-nucleotidase family)
MIGFGRVLLVSFIMIFNISCREGLKDFSFSGKTILLESEKNKKDSLIESIIIQYRTDLEADMNKVLVYSSMVMERGTPEGTLNNFVADLVLERGKELYNPEDDKPIDFCLLNYGGLRVPLPKGEITFSRVYELLPFENEMVVVTLSGQKTLELFKYLATSTVGMPVSGVRLVIENNEPAAIYIDGKPFDENRYYKVLTSDYLAGGGDSMDFFLQPINYELLGVRVRDAIIEHMKEVHDKGQMISASLDQRIVIKNH